MVSQNHAPFNAIFMLNIVYEDKQILVVNKPAGMPVHADAHHAAGTVLQEVRAQYPEAELAHRLDKDTSGLLMVAKNKGAYIHVKKMFKERAIQKTYLALVAGDVRQEEGAIKLAIGRSTKDFRKRVAQARPDANARAAETHFRVLKRFGGYTLLEVSPKTGRTHQIRSHLASIGHPVACDQLYGGKKYACPAGLTHQFLHAAILEFTGPEGGRLRLEAELAEDLRAALAVLHSL